MASSMRLAGDPIGLARHKPGLVTRLATIDDVLEEHAPVLGRDFVGYRNHVYRVVNLCARISNGCAPLEKIAVAGVFHDLGIWTDGTFDYLAPSIALARAYLVARGRRDWVDDVEAMVANHHKITRSGSGSLVESFRRADWIDVTGGLRGFGVSRRFISRLFRAWPSAGFHVLLVKLAIRRVRTNPLTPLPMVKL